MPISAYDNEEKVLVKIWWDVPVVDRDAGLGR